MKASLLSIGTELLMGEITNTNAVYLSRELKALGIDVLYHYTVGDNHVRLAEMIRESFTDCDLVLTTGGLGPTQDDMTREVACQVMGDELVMHEDLLENIRSRIERRGRKMTNNNRKQAMIPSRARVLFNDVGTAPGFILADPEEKKQIICMPGPPREMTYMFENKVKPILEEKADGVLFSRMLRTFGIGESQLETELIDLIDGQTDPTLATYAKAGECALRIASKRPTAAEAKAAVARMEGEVFRRVGNYIYSDADEELVAVTGKLLLEKGLTIAAAESCTGGLFGGTLTQVPGISASFDRSLVTYSNEAKIQELGVKEETLRKFGAVSEETAQEMAEGARSAAGTDIGSSVTGIAGPDGGTEEKPVGTIYIGFVYGDTKICKKLQRSTGEREMNRRYAVLSMLDMIRRNI